ncbi:MAG: HlyD family secretion protein [Lysinibacillus sp.]
MRLTAFLKRRPWTSISILLLLVLISVNAFYTFKDDSRVNRTYFIDSFQKAHAGRNVERLDKDAIVAPAEIYTVTADASSLAAINVKRGQEVLALDALATYKAEEVDEELTKLEAEKSAYEDELSSLEDTLDDIESDYARTKDPKSSINSKDVAGLLNIDVELELTQQNSPFTAIAILNRHIAEANRQIEFVDAKIEQIESRKGILNPIDGVIANITEDAGNVTFEIYSQEKSMFAYLSEDEWQQVIEGQEVELEMKHFKGDLAGAVLEKQMIATAANSIWANELAKSAKLPKPSNYEVVIQQEDALEDIPFSTVGSASIIVNEALDSYKVNSDWVKKKMKKVPSSVYVVGADGKLRLEPIDVEFKTDTSTVFLAPFEKGTVILSNKQRNIMAPTFRSMPIQKVEWKQFKELSWKRYAKYIVF